MSAQDIIQQIKKLPPPERAQVTEFVMENASMAAERSTVIVTGDEGLPLIRGTAGVITSKLVHELESLTS